MNRLTWKIVSTAGLIALACLSQQYGLGSVMCTLAAYALGVATVTVAMRIEMRS